MIIAHLKAVTLENNIRGNYKNKLLFDFLKSECITAQLQFLGLKFQGLKYV